MLDQILAIVVAQWRTMRNFYPRAKAGGVALTVILTVIWYGLVAAGAWAISILLAGAGLDTVRTIVGKGLLFVLIYWQMVPILLASTGMWLDLKRLSVYPVTHNQLYAMDVVLRLTTGLEMLILVIGAAIGLARNAAVPAWAIAGFFPFVFFNLFLAVGLRSILDRLLTKWRIREFVIFFLILATALPQVLLRNGAPPWARLWLEKVDFSWWPWTATGQLVSGHWTAAAWLAILAWTALALAYSRWQFEAGFRYDADEQRSRLRSQGNGQGLLEWFYRLPSRFFSDPMGAIIEKEIRFLSRAPRFRMVFFMGFSFGLAIWLPLAFGAGPSRAQGSIAGNYLTFVTLYALMLLGEVSFWNTFGFDRAAAQAYFLMPAPFANVLMAKNIAASVFVLLEITAVAAVCGLLGMPLSPAKLLECYSVSLIMTLYLISIGNLGSAYYPRPVSPSQTWRSATTGKFQAMLLLVYPVVAIPVALAYLARYAFDTQWAFYGMLALGGLFGGVIYWVSMESAVTHVNQQREQFLHALSEGDGPIAA